MIYWAPFQMYFLRLSTVPRDIAPEKKPLEWHVLSSLYEEKKKKKGCKEHFCTESYPLLKLWASFKAGIYWGLKIRRWNCMFNCKHCRKLWIFILVINFWHPIEIQVILENSAMSFWQESELLILLVCRKYKNYDGLTQGIFSLCYRKLLKVGESVGDRHCYLLLGQSISHWLEILPSGQW